MNLDKPKTVEEIIQEFIGIKIGAGKLTPMDYSECITCMNAYASQFKSPIEQLEKENARLKEVEDCNKRTIISLRETIVKLK